MSSNYTNSYKWMEQASVSLPVIITVAVNGGIQGKELHENLPETPDEIAVAAYDAYNAGASIIHIHGRDPKNLASCSVDPDVYREINAKVRAKCPNIIINNSTGGGMTTTMEDRYRSLDAEPEMATLNMGPDMSKFELPPRKAPLPHPHDGWKFDGCIPFTYESINKLTRLMNERNVKPEMEIYHPGQYWPSNELIREKLVKSPYLFQFVMGIQTAMYPTPWNLISMADELPENSIFFVSGIGKFQWAMVTQSLILGGHVRVGFEDNLYLHKGQKLTNNAEAVAKVVRIAKELGRPVASSVQAREMLGLSIQPKVY